MNMYTLSRKLSILIKELNNFCEILCQYCVSVHCESILIEMLHGFFTVFCHPFEVINSFTTRFKTREEIFPI